MPFIMSWPDVIPTQVYDQPVISLDIAATLLEVAGLGVDPSLDGAGPDALFDGEVERLSA